MGVDGKDGSDGKYNPGYGYFAVALNTLVLRDMPRAQVLSNTQC